MEGIITSSALAGWGDTRSWKTHGASTKFRTPILGSANPLLGAKAWSECSSHLTTFSPTEITFTAHKAPTTIHSLFARSLAQGGRQAYRLPPVLSLSAQRGLRIGLCVLERGDEVYPLRERRGGREEIQGSGTYSWEKMSCFGCFKPDKKVPPRRTESREVTVVNKAPSQNEAPPRESGKDQKTNLARKNKELACFCTVSN